MGEPALASLLVVAMLTGAAFLWLDYGFTGGFRGFLDRSGSNVLGAAFIVPAVAALLIIPVATSVEGYDRFVAPVGFSLILGAAIFGVGMQIANGCGSGTLVAAGQGSRRMLIALPFFCLGGVLGSLAPPTTLEWPGIGPVDLADRLHVAGIGFHLSEVKGPVMDALKRSDFFEHFKGRVFLSQFEAVQALGSGR